LKRKGQTGKGISWWIGSQLLPTSRIYDKQAQVAVFGLSWEMTWQHSFWLTPSRLQLSHLGVRVATST